MMNQPFGSHVSEKEEEGIQGTSSFRMRQRQPSRSLATSGPVPDSRTAWHRKDPDRRYLPETPGSEDVFQGNVSVDVREAFAQIISDIHRTNSKPGGRLVDDIF